MESSLTSNFEERARTFLDLVDKCDNFPLTFPTQPSVHSINTISRFFVNRHLIGYLRSSVVTALKNDFPKDFDHTLNSLNSYDVRFVGSDLDNATEQEVSGVLSRVVSTWRSQDKFKVLRGWRDEEYTIYGPRRTRLFNLERAACGLFGVVTYGAHLTVYRPPTRSGEELMIWCPRRSKTKATYPSMLDNSVAGGVSQGLSPYETIIKEDDEEASIPESMARDGVKAVGCISYMYVDGDVDDEGGGGWIQPEVQYIYDLALTGSNRDFKLVPSDGEAENFELWPVSKVTEEMLAGHFKPNCAAVLIEFFIRHGILEEDGSGEYLKILQRLHRMFEFPC